MRVWSGGVAGSGYIYSGHNDSSPSNAVAATSDDNDGYYGTGNTTPSNQRRTLLLTNGEVIWDFAGNVYEWTSGTIASSQQPGLTGESAYAWKEWNNGSLQWNGFPTSSRPGSVGATGYSTTQGIGQLYSNYGETSTRAFGRGGYWAGGTIAGVLALRLDVVPSNMGSTVGFRAAK